MGKTFPPFKLQQTSIKLSQTKHIQWRDDATYSLAQNLPKEVQEWINHLMEGTPSVKTHQQILRRALAATHTQELTPECILRFMHISQQTCNARSIAQYGGILRKIAEANGCQWANNKIFQLINRGLRRTAPPTKGARPLNAAYYRIIHAKLHLPEQLALEIAYLTGSRMDEVERLRKNHVQLLTNPQIPKQARLTPETASHYTYVFIQTHGQSKTAHVDPEAVRFLDVALLPTKHANQLLHLLSYTHPFFSRSKLMTALRSLHLTEHSPKKGCAVTMTEIVLDNNLPESLIPQMLKHKNPTETIGSTTMTYLPTTRAKLNILTHKKVTTAAVLMQQHLLQCYNPLELPHPQLQNSCHNGSPDS